MLKLFFILLAVFIYAAILGAKTALSIKQQKNIEDKSRLIEPFVLSKYFEHTEKAFIDTLQNRNPVDRTIVLWFGLDGLQMNEEGTFEWISRANPKSANQNISHQMCQSAPILFDGLQNTQATQEQILALKMQQQMQGINSTLQSYMVPMPGYIGYSPYLQSAALSSPLSQCWCNLYK